MRLPAVAPAAVFACGVLLGQIAWFSQRASSPRWLLVAFASVVLLIALGLAFTKLTSLWPAAALSLASWLLLGTLGAAVANQPRPADHILTLIDSGRLTLNTPLRWHGYLRDEPSRLPWGYGYELALTGVEYQGALLPAQGGLRISLASQPNQVLPDIHAGDAIVAAVQAKLPQLFRDEGAFDRRAYLAQQDVHLVATLRAPQLLERAGTARPTAATLLAHARRKLRDELDSLFANSPNVAAVLRAMLLGDRSFIDRDEAVAFQKTGVFHVLVVAGLHVGAFAVFLFWLGRKLKLSPPWTVLATLALLSAYFCVVEERPPVLRAAVMTAIVVLGRLFFRRLDLLNSAAIAALLLLIAKPLAIRDPSFQLTFLAIACIAGLALPWLDRSIQPYLRAFRGWRDVTRDASHEPRAAQFRIDLRSTTLWLSSRLPTRIQNPCATAIVRTAAFSLRICELLVITLVLQVGMLPLMARDFHRITLDAPLVNLVAVPLVGLIVPLGFLALASGLLLPWLAKLLAAPLGWLVLFLLHIVNWFAGFPRWSYRIPGPPLWLITLFLIAALVLCIAARLSRLFRAWAWRSALLLVIATALAIALFPFPPQYSPGKLELTVLDVGQGDSLFVVSPHGKTLLIDGGGAFGGFPGREERHGIDPGEEAVSPYLWSRGFQKLDVVALTHAHQDHIGGLTAILQNFHVGTLWIGREVSSAPLANLERLASEKKIPIIRELRGNSFSWDTLTTQFLWPETVPQQADAPPKNDDSLVLRLQYRQRSILLPGDAEKQSEASILSENDPSALHADVLKVGHHGSKNSTTAAFLAAVHPRFAIISAGEDNPYGHPNPELLARLQDAGVRILRTDRHGAVHVFTDGAHLQINCFVECPEASANDAAKDGTPTDLVKNAQAQLPQH